MSLCGPRRKLRPSCARQHAIGRKIGEPEPMNMAALRVEQPTLKQRLLSGGAAVNNHTAEVSQAARAFIGVLAAQHFKYSVDTFAMSEVPDRFFVIDFLVIDAVLQAEFSHTSQLVFGR